MILAGLALAAGVALVSCSVGRAASGPPSTTSTTQVRLVAPSRYTPLPGEPAPELKQLAADALQAIGAYDVGGGTPAAALERVAARADSSVVDEAAPLLVPTAASAIDIVYPQLGGLTSRQASVMVVFRQRLLEAGRQREVSRVADVRLARAGAGWSVSAIASLGGDRISGGPLAANARAVLASKRIELPDSARWDIEAGRIDDRVLDLLVRLSGQHTLNVTVLASGHPHNVFATESVSNHTEGRAVDIWAVDGQPVVAQRDPAGPLHALVQQLLADGVTELGSPWDLDGPGRGASFTNTVHQDHLHLAFDR